MAVGLGSVDMPVPSVAEWEWLNWKFPRTVHAGDTIYARTTVVDKVESRSKPDRGVVTVETVGENQRGEIVCEFRRKVLVPKRPGE